MDGVGRKFPKSVSGKEVLHLSSLMAIFPSWQSLLVQCRLPIIPLNYQLYASVNCLHQTLSVLHNTDFYAKRGRQEVTPTTLEMKLASLVFHI